MDSNPGSLAPWSMLCISVLGIAHLLVLPELGSISGSGELLVSSKGPRAQTQEPGCLVSNLPPQQWDRGKVTAPPLSLSFLSLKNGGNSSPWLMGVSWGLS